MTKILLAVLTFAALLYAAWLVLLRKHLPDPGAARGWRRRFLLAAGLFALFLSGTTQTPRPDPDASPSLRGWFSMRAFGGEGAERARTFVEVVRDVWQNLKREDAGRFQDAANAAVNRGELRYRDAAMLKVAFERIAYHHWATRDRPMVMCYAPHPLNNIQYSSSEAALKQIELLRDMKRKGTLDAATVEKARTTLARELETLHRVHREEGRISWQDAQAVFEEYRAGGIEPGDAALVAVATILELEGVARPESASPAARLQAMRKRVETLLRGGPFGNDWRDPALRPNVQTLLNESGVLPVEPIDNPGIMCYRVVVMPRVEERSAEMKQLQAKLLEKQVEAGVLDAETAERIRKADERDAAADFATEADIRAYQKKVRRIIGILYKRGEVPPSFVRELEHAIALEIIDVDPAKALRDDMRWHLRSALRTPLGDAVLDALVERELIPPAQNHRFVKTPHGFDPRLRAGDRERLEGFLAMIDGEEPIRLDSDGEWVIYNRMIPETDREYILKMRRVVRALRKADVIQTDDLLERFDKVLRLKMIGRLHSEPAPPRPPQFFRRAEDGGE